MTQHALNSGLVGTRSTSASLMGGYDLGAINSRGDFVVYWNDFQNDANDLDLTNIWEAVDVGTVTLDPSTFVNAGDGNGVLRMSADNSADAEGNCLTTTATASLLANCVTPRTDHVILFEARVTCSDWDVMHWFVGLFQDPTTTALMDTNGDLMAARQYLGFHYNDDDDVAGIPALLAAGGNDTAVTTTASATIAAGTDATYRNLGLRINGTTGIEWYIDAELVGSATLASAYDGTDLFIAFAEVSNTTANPAETFDVDYVWTAQTRNP